MKQGFIPLTWPEFKNYLNTNLVQFKGVSRTNYYELFLIEQGLIASCVIPKNGGSDQVDFEANYLSQANRPFNYYSTPINIRQTAGTGAGATVFAMRNATSSTKKVVIENINLVMTFDSGTPLGRSLLRYGIQGFSAATPTGGTSQAVVPLDSSSPATTVTDVRFLDTGLTTTGVSFGNTVMVLGCPASDGSIVSFLKHGPIIKLSPGEGFCIRLAVAAVAGQGLTGEICWSERQFS